MINVVMLTQTNYKGRTLKKDQVVMIDETVADRWMNRNIAALSDEEPSDVIDEPKKDNPLVDPEKTTEDDPVATGKYVGMKAKELYALCKDRNIEAEARQPDEYYIGLLEASDKEAE